MKWPWSRPATVRARSSFPFADLLTEARCRDLEILVRWLAAPYGDNMPVFATELPDGRPLKTGLMLERLYAEIVGPTQPAPGGTWYQCPSCSHWQIRSDLLLDPTPENT